MILVKESMLGYGVVGQIDDKSHGCGTMSSMQ